MRRYWFEEVLKLPLLTRGVSSNANNAGVLVGAPPVVAPVPVTRVPRAYLPTYLGGGEILGKHYLFILLVVYIIVLEIYEPFHR